MPRQPFSTKGPDIGFALGPGFLEQRPAATALIGECIALWTEVELQAAVLLAAMLGANTQPAAAMYFTLANERAKREAMAAIADSVLSDEDRTLFHAWARLKKSIEKERNDLAHGLFGISEIEPEGVIWISTQHRIRNLLDMLQTVRTGALPSRQQMEDLGRYIFVYKLSDLIRIKEDTISLHSITWRINAALGPLDERSKSEARQWLSQQPLMARFLSQTSSSPRSGSSEPSPPPP